MIDREMLQKIQAALKPFHDFAGTMADHTAANMAITMGSSLARRQLTMGDVKLARDTFDEIEALLALPTEVTSVASSPKTNVVSDTKLPDAPF